MDFVLDASMAVSLILEDERDDISNRVSESMFTNLAYVPALWHCETRNSFIMAHRRGRQTRAELTRNLSLISRLPVETVNDPDHDRVADRALETGLTMYDALYLVLAADLGVSLATRDRALSRAAAHVGVTLIT